MNALMFCVKYRSSVILDSVRVFKDEPALIKWLKKPNLDSWIEGDKFVYDVGSKEGARLLPKKHLVRLGLR